MDEDGSKRVSNPKDKESECPECGAKDFEPVEEDSEELACGNCGYVNKEVDWTEYSHADTDESRRKNLEDLEELPDRQSESPSSETSGPFADYWHHDPAIFALMSDDGTKQEFYQIDNPEEFFQELDVEGDSSWTRDERVRRKIQQSDIDPFQKVDIPYIDWRFTL